MLCRGGWDVGGVRVGWGWLALSSQAQSWALSLREASGDTYVLAESEGARADFRKPKKPCGHKTSRGFWVI